MRPMAKKIVCNDGVKLIIGASEFHYCKPRDNVGPYVSVEVGFIEDKNNNPVIPPESWSPYSDDEYPDGVFYTYVPIELVEEFVKKHKGISLQALL